MTDTISQLEGLANELKRANELKDANDRADRELAEKQGLIVKAEADLAFVKKEVEDASRKLVDTTNEVKKTLQAADVEIVAAHAKRDGAKKEHEDYVASTASARRELEEKERGIVEKLSKLEEKEKAAFAVLEKKKSVVEQARKESADLETKLAFVNQNTNAMKQLDETLSLRDAELKNREEKIKNQEQLNGEESHRLDRKSYELGNLENSLVAREAKVKEDEARLDLKRQADTERETFLIKLSEELKFKGVKVGPVDLEPVEAKEETKVEISNESAPVSGTVKD